MKQLARFLASLWIVCLSLASAHGALSTNNYIGISPGLWETPGSWSLGIPTNGQSWVIITNSPPKNVLITDSTPTANLTISNLLINCATAGGNGVNLTTTNTFTILQNLVLSNGCLFTVTNATVDIKGQSGGFVTDNGAIIIYSGAFLATNALSGLDIGHGGSGSLMINGGQVSIIGEEVGTFAGDRGTLTIAGGTNVVTTDGLFIGDSGNATGVVWITGGALIETNTTTYLGNLGSGRLAVSNGSVLARQLVIGNAAGGAGTLTMAGGNVETPDTGLLFPLLLGQFADGTGTVWVTGGSFVSTNGTPRIGDSGAGTIIVSNGTVLLRRAILGYTAGAGTLSVAGGSLRITGTGEDFSIGDAATTRGTVLLSGGELVMTNDVADDLFIGNAGIGSWTQSGGTGNVVGVILANSDGGVGTLTVSGGLLTGTGSLTVGEGSGSTGTVWLTGGSLSFTDMVTLVADPAGAVGSITVSNGTAELREVTIGVFGDGALTMVGGTLDASVSFTLAYGLSTTATLTQSGGWLITTNAPSISTGTVIIQSSGGTWLAGGLSFAYANAGTFTISGGTNILDGGLTVGSSMGSGAVWVTSGQLSVTNGSTTIASDSISQFTVTGGVVQLRDVTVAASSPAGSLTVAGGDVTLATTLAVGVGFGGSSGTLTVSGGHLTVNGDSQLGFIGGTGTLKVSGGSITAQAVTLGVFGGTGRLQLTGGALSVTNLTATSGPASPVTFNAGTLNSAATAVTNTAQFAVGDGVSAAHFHLLGGRHAFNNGLRIRNNATLSGCGTIASTVVVDAGGTVIADCGGLLTFTGSVTNNGLLRATNGSVLEGYGPVVNNGLIDIMDGTTNFHSTFINNGTIVDASYFRVVNITKQSNDINLTWTTVGGHSYVVQTNAPPSGGSYTNNFSDFSPTIAVPGQGLGTTNYLDVGGATNVPSRFYRVRLVP